MLNTSLNKAVLMIKHVNKRTWPPEWYYVAEGARAVKSPPPIVFFSLAFPVMWATQIYQQ